IIIDNYTIDEEFTSVAYGAAEKALEKFGETPENVMHYSFLDIGGGVVGNTIYLSPEKRDMFENSLAPDIRQLFIVTVEDYNRLMGKNETLSDGEIILYVNGGSFGYDTLIIDEYGTFNVKSKAEDFEITGRDAMMSSVISMYLFVKDEAVVKELYDLQLGIYGNSSSYMHDYYGFDLNCNEEKQLEIFEDIYFNIAQFQKDLADAGREGEWRGVRIESAANDRADFIAIYGGLFFLGVVFGMVFICAAALIMYYKQISEGFEDKSKFGILQKVGMTKAEIRKSINSQVLTVFFMPLGAAGLHMFFAFPIVSRLLLLFGLSNTVLFAVVTLCCFGAFSLVYTAVYLITSRSYYKIVSTDRD
ncbi:MAG: ABC transporter permease, partial [Oscillospiraceae bacterium]|nr:ABC transporter permease [Oscillospiraceae bacterium]